MREERFENNDYVFPFIAYISDELSENPAIIFHLHGAGERGNGENLDLVLTHGFPKTYDNEYFKDCILVMPQCPENSFWAAKVESLKVFMDRIIEKYSADKNRVYLTGLSMGGFGTWYTANAYPDMFAAIAPCCGGGLPWNAGVLNMPVWAFHGVEDPTVSVTQSDEMVAQLKKSGAEVKYTRLEGVGHNVWEYAYNKELFDWLLSKKRT